VVGVVVVVVVVGVVVVVVVVVVVGVVVVLMSMKTPAAIGREFDECAVVLQCSTCRWLRAL
jgi:uncharacterized metal-binding protein